MDVFDLEAFIRLNVDEYMNELGNAEEATKNTGSKLKSVLGGAAKAVGAGFAAAGTAVVKMGKDAFEAYANYEQLVGGVETLFKKSAATVEAYADIAYQTAGLSANEYMETVTGFSASLIQSLDGDTSKAAEIANRAIVDMSDNANKMGSDISSIQNAYAGFAKQNYTMLDNLKLGYGGTKEEMERLISDANELAIAQGKVDQSQLKLVVDQEEVSKATEALAKAQEQLSSKQASAEKAQLSYNEAVNKHGKSSTQAQKAYITLTQAQEKYQAALDKVSDAQDRVTKANEGTLTAFDINSYADIIDAIHLIQTEMNISGLSAEEAAEAVEKGLMTEEEAFEKMGTTAKEANTTIQGSIASMKSAWQNLLVGISDDSQPFDKLVDNFVNSVDTVADNIIPRIDKILEGIGTLIEKLVPKLADRLPSLFEKILPGLVKAATSLINSLSKSLPEIIKILIKVLVDNISVIVDGLIELVVALVGALPEIIGPIIEALPTIIDNVVDGLMRALPQLINGIVQMAIEITKHLPEIINIILKSFGPLGEGISSLFEEGFKVVGPIVEEVGGLLSELFGGIALLLTDPEEALNRFFDWFHDKAELTIQSIKDLFTGLFQLIPALIDEGVAEERESITSKKMQELIDQGIREIDENGNYRFTKAYAEKMGLPYEGDTTVHHEGTIEIRGVNNEGELIGASNAVIDDITTTMQREARLGYGY